MANNEKQSTYKKNSNIDHYLELKNLIAQLTSKGELHTTLIPELSLFRRDEPTQMVASLYEPSICLVIQGAKRVFLGDETYEYNTSRYLITSVNLPATVQVIEASPEKPYLGLKLNLNRHEISKMMVNCNLPSPKEQKSNRGMATGELTLPLLTSFQRLVDLLNHPDDIPILSPLIQKEIIYRLLTGEQGTRLRQIASAGSQSHHMATVIDWLNDNFKKQITIDELTDKACMSTSTFHHHFKSITAMSPLQYIKTLRLHEARRLMLMEDIDAAHASFHVGYDSPSQFSREYKRQFGESPQKDIKNLSKEFN